MQFELKGIEYRTAKLTVFEQLKVSRKLLPVMAGVLNELKSGQASFQSALPAIAQSLSSLSDDDCNAILFPCLAVASRQHGKNWMPVFDRTSEIINFDDLDMMDILQIVGKVVGDSLGNFLQGLPDDATQAKTPA